MSKVIKFERSTITWEDALQGFLFWKQAQGISDTTLNDYRCHVKMFFKRFPDSWQTENLRQSILEYMADKIKPATYNLRLIYLRAFFNWCIEEGYIFKNPFVGLKRRKASERIVDIPEDTLKELLTLPDLTNFTGLRDFALILLTLDTGIRPKEAFFLYNKDFNFKHLLVIVPTEVSKTRTERVLPILPATAKAIQGLINARHPNWDTNCPVFCTYEGNSLNRNAWNKRLNYYSKKLGIKIRPYDLRHTFAIQYLRLGGHAFSLQKTLGHTDIQMTKKYVNLTGQDLKDIHIKASPLNKLITKSKNHRICKLNKNEQ